MARLAQPRTGKFLEIKKRPLRFSFWPMYHGTRRLGLQSSAFVTDPWALIGQSINTRCPQAARQEAINSLSQARSFYESGLAANLPAAKPLLFYYAFMNLGKAYALTVGVQASFDEAHHGMSPARDPFRTGLARYQVEAFQSPNARTGKINLFDDILFALSGRRLSAAKQVFSVEALAAQSVAGHRVWAGTPNRKERFISVERIEIMEAKLSKEIWMNVRVFSDDLTRLNTTHAMLLDEARLALDFTEVDPGTKAGRRLLCFEQSSSINYSNIPSDQLPNLISGIKERLWTIVQSIPPYRKYYLYMSPASEQSQVLPQLASAYMLMFFLSTVTRYRPQDFDQLLGERDGPFLTEFLDSQPKQFIYLMASEFAQREITQPAIVH